MRNFLLSIALASLMANAQQKQFLTEFEKKGGNESATYHQAIEYFRELAAKYPTINIKQMGLTDSGEPLHIVVFDPEKKFDISAVGKSKSVILINNAIHAGEPDGIDATMQLFRDFATEQKQAPKNVVLVAIPVYNIGGALNRNSTSRVNQNGPKEYGFRGNARNFDLNRDFIKSDTKNTKSFVEIFQLCDPDILIDNHVSNGADYQYVLTYIATQHNKLGNVLGGFLDKQMTPAIVSALQKKKIESTPYVNVWGATPDKGFAQFFESPRYATGYASLFNTIGFVVETHMLKPYAQRVAATYEFMLATIDYADKNVDAIKSARDANSQQYKPGRKYPVGWAIDSAKATTIRFNGYEGIYKKSTVTTGNRLFYDRSKPFSKNIPFFKEYKSTAEVVIPSAYVIPQGWWPVIELLLHNKAEFYRLENDTILNVESYKISDFKTTPTAYEGHYLHRNTQVSATERPVSFRKGDYVFPVKAKGAKYLLETLEPQCVDSFFNWNFFDTVLQQKEGYSDYVFEDLAAKLLAEDPALKQKFDEKMKEAEFASQPRAQLDWIYKNSPHYEAAHLQYPVFRMR